MNFYAFCLFFGMSAMSVLSAHAEDFADTTDGTSQESSDGFSKEQFEEMKNSPDPQVRKFYKNLTEGRFSSSKKGDSRYSGHLELHDFDQDGISDHGTAANDAEGGVEEAIIGKKGTAGGEKRTSALDEARLKKGQCVKNATGTPKPCNNISAAILDVGSAHPGKDDPNENHRVYMVNPEVQKKMTQAGENYFAKFKAEVLDLGKGDKARDYGNDALRSEAVWLYKQWQFKMESSWKTLRAARLADFDTAPGQDSKGRTREMSNEAREFMHRMGNLFASNPSDRTVAEEIFFQSRLLLEDFCTKKTGADKTWGDCKPAATEPDKFISKTLGEIIRLKTNDPGLAPGETWPLLDARTKTGLYNEAMKRARKESAKSKEDQTAIANIAKCMKPEVWCHRPRDRKEADPKTGPKIEAFTPVRGDPGNVFDDTREGLFIKMSEASKRPLAQQRAYVEGSIDFARKMSGGRDNPIYLEWDKYISRVEKEVKDIRDTAKAERLKLEAAGGKSSDIIERTFDPNTKTILQIYGNNAVNETYSAGYGFSGSPAPASTGGPKPTLPGVDFKN